MTISYLSVFSGIEAWSVACKGLDYSAVGFSEIDPFASAVLAARFGSNLPGQPLSHNAPPNFGDVTKIPLDKIGRVDLLVGGSPCQAFSFAGKRLSLADVRGNLTLAYAVLAHELARSHGCRNALWENVPGVLSTDDNAFGCFLGALVGADDALLPSPKPAGKRGNDLWTFSKELGDIRPAWPNAGMVAGPRARAAWRVLDAQYFGLAQRRERVFVVVDFGNGADPAAVLFEPQSLSGNSPPSREAGQNPAPTISARTNGGGGLGTDFDLDLAHLVADVASTLPAGGNATGGNRYQGTGAETAATYLVAFDSTQITSKANRTNPQAGDPCHPLAAQGHAPAVVFAIQERAVSENPNAGPDGMGVKADVAYTLEARNQVQAVAFDLRGREGGSQFEGPHDTAAIRAASGGSSRSYVAETWAVRRLTPTETARLQGFPDDHCRIPWRGKPAEECPDGPQYKTHGNSMAVKNMRWLAERIERLLMRGTP